MTFFKWRRIRIALPVALFAAMLMLTLHIFGVSRQAPQNPAAPTTGAGAAAGQQGTTGDGRRGGGPGGARGGRGAGGGGARGGPVLGDGPWDFGEGESRVHVTVVTKGVDHPWAMAFLPDGDMLVTERAGRLRAIRKGVLDPTPLAGLPQIRVGGLGGLLDVVLHPNFPQNRLIYLAYSKPGDEEPANSSLAIYRAKWDGGATLTEGRDIFITQPRFGARGSSPANCCGQGPSDNNSDGSRLAFDKAGYLYVTVGDRNHGEWAQDTTKDVGKIIRLKDDGTIPSDNPFVGREGYLPEIYSIGHRNPLGLTIDPENGTIWSTEFGPRGGDELNRIQAGKNYGWMDVTNGTHYDGSPAKLGKTTSRDSKIPSRSGCRRARGHAHLIPETLPYITATSSRHGAAISSWARWAVYGAIRILCCA